MLRLNRMTDYAILVLGALARRHGETLASGHLATVTKLAQPTVAKVLKMLLAAELVETQRGVEGRLPAHEDFSAHISYGYCRSDGRSDCGYRLY